MLREGARRRIVVQANTDGRVDMAQAVAGILGPVLAGAALGLAGVTAALWGVSALLAVAMVVASRLPRSPAGAAPRGPRGAAALWWWFIQVTDEKS